MKIVNIAITPDSGDEEESIRFVSGLFGVFSAWKDAKILAIVWIALAILFGWIFHEWTIAAVVMLYSGFTFAFLHFQAVHHVKDYLGKIRSNPEKFGL